VGGADIGSMSKRALLRFLASAALGLAYVVAAGADVDLDIDSRSDCIGLLSFPHWFDEACKAARGVRLTTLLVGTVAAAILLYFAERGARPRSSVITWLLALAKLSGPDEVALEYHEVEWSSDDSHYRCTDCGFETEDEEEAKSHRWQEVPNTAADEPPSFKQCPDCAEDVQPGARECRSCGYMFESNAEPSRR
jgi:hypothetical protein